MSAKVGVVIPFYNSSKYLRATLKSLQYQGVNLAVYLINDGSSEKEKKALEKICNDFKNIFLIHKNNGGLSSARNAGIDKCKEDYLIFLDSDDLLGYYQLYHQITEIEKNKSDCCMSRYTISDAMVSTVKNQPSYSGEGISKKYLMEFWERGISIPIHSVLFLRKSLDFIRFNEELKSKEDFDFWLRYFSTKRELAFVDDYMCIYRVLRNSMSRNKNISVNSIYQIASEVINNSNNSEDEMKMMANIRINYGMWKSL
jgi:glycosyltransferase involved in cell wall biosynthesis